MSMQTLSAAAVYLRFQDPAPWNPFIFWRERSDLPKALFLWLALMLAYVLVISGERLLGYTAARRSSGHFVRAINPPLARESLGEAMDAAAGCPLSHIARVVLDGLAAFTSYSNRSSVAEAADAARGAALRSRSVVSAELRSGLGTLRLVASTAPFVGLLGTVFGILSAFRGTAGAAASDRAYIAEALAEALLSTGVGLAVALLAAWSHNYLMQRVEIFDLEMHHASSELEFYLRTRPGLLRHSYALRTEAASLLARSEARRGWEVRFDRPVLLLAVFYFYALFAATFFILSLLESGRPMVVSFYLYTFCVTTFFALPLSVSVIAYLRGRNTSHTS